MLLKIHFLFWK